MSTSKLSLIMVLVVAALSGVGCGNKKDDAQPIRQTGRVAGQNGYTGTLNPGEYYVAATGQITGGSDVNQQVQAFLAPIIDVNQLGTVDPYSGMTFTGMIRFDQAGNLIPGNSGISIKIKDSVEMQSPQYAIQPIGIPGQSGRFDRNSGQTTVTFGDAYGQVTLEGYMSGGGAQASQFQGTIRFSNRNGGQGTLGQFRINTCGFFVCGQ
ncbi:MAG: hypothetical protein BroJett040_20780 [Oligoflexia bacterium]|nr:MAG: hypothetical protein BroJett040_20780 [Oligoflexia bacterium]